MDEFFAMVQGRIIEFQEDGEVKEVEFIEEAPDIKFNLEQINMDEFILEPTIESFDYSILEGKEYIYILLENKLYKTDKEYKNTVLKLLDVFKKFYKRNQI